MEIIPNEKVVSLVTDSRVSSFKDKREWTGTKITFEIAEVNGKNQASLMQVWFQKLNAMAAAQTHAAYSPKFIQPDYHRQRQKGLLNK